MLYLIGGVGRSGKSVLARKLAERLHISYFGLDVLMMGMHHGNPDFGIGPDVEDEVVANKMWPIVEGMVINLLEVEDQYILEGAYLMPKHLGQISTEFGAGVRCLYLGYAETSAKTKRDQIELGAGQPNDWMNGLADDVVLGYAERSIKRSVQAKAQCRELGVHFLDTGKDFRQAIELGVSWLLG